MAAMEMRGSLNVSQYHKPGSNTPKYYGKALINGVEYVIKGWEKEGARGTWTSLLFEDAATLAKAKERLEDEFAPAPKKAFNPNTDWREDDIPF